MLPSVARVPPTPVFAALAAMVQASVLTWPLLLNPVSRLVGHPGNDNWNHVWGYWWVADELSRGEWPLRTDLLSFPSGGTLYFIDTVQVLLFLPLQLLGGPALAYNAAVWSGLAFAGFCAWLLARRVTGDDVVSGVAMVIYGASPHLLGQAYNGISETVCAGWLPLTLWCLLRLLDRSTWGRAVALAAAGGLCILTSWYYGLFAALAGTIIVIWTALRQPRSVTWTRAFQFLLVSAVMSLTLVLPMFSAFSASLEADDALVTRDPGFVEASLLNHNITDVLAFLRISKQASPDLLALYGEELVIVIYLGWTAVLLALAAFWFTRRGRELSLWLWLGLLFGVFSLGPYLNVGGEYLELFGRRVPLPFLVLFEAFPVFDRISHPFRFVTGVSLALAMLGSHGLRHMLRARPAPQRLGAVVAVAALFLAEIYLGSPATLPIPTSVATIPAAYSDMAEDPVEGAVLDLPMTMPNLERALYVWYQAEHERPVPWGLNDPMPRQLLTNRLTATLIRIEATRARTLPPRLPELDLVVAGMSLERQGYRYVVLHERFYPEFKAVETAALLTGVFGEPQRFEADRMLVWTLEPPT